MQIGNYRFNEALAMDLAEKALYVVGILIIAWAAAKAAKWAFAQLVDTVGFFQRDTGSGENIGDSLGKIVSLLIWLFGLLTILSVLELNGVMAPIENLLNNIMGFIPNLIGAGLIFFVGLMVARIVRDIVVTALQTVDFDKWANRGGVDTVTGNSTISSTIGTIIYILIIIPVAILALEALQLQSVSEPASNMLQLIFDAIPRIIGAAILLGIGYVISKFVVQMMKEVLPGLGVDQALSQTGLVSEKTKASSIIARVVQVAIILFFAIAATRLLGFPELTNLLDKVLNQGGSIVLGAAIIGVGFLVANLLARLVAGDEESTLAATIVRWVTVVLFLFMGLDEAGIGGMIAGNTLTIIVAGIAVAGALAFGLGGRDWAAKKLEQLDKD